MWKDIYATYFLGALLSFALVAYGVRVAVRGAARSERVGRIGGTLLVDREVMDWWYWTIDPILRALVALGVTANMLTWSALVLGVAAAAAVAYAQVGLACLLATASTICDIFDGQVARITNTGSNRGELLDAAVDRYTEFAYLGGLAVWFHESLWQLMLVMGAMLATFMVSYASAKAEAMQVSPPRGLMRRHERATYLIMSTGFTSVFGDYLRDHFGLPDHVLILGALALVAVVGNFAAVQRLVRISRAL